MRKIRIIICLFFVLLLAGCESQLYTGLNEREGNDMLALLLDADIPATKTLNKDLQVTVFVPEKDVARSIRLLRSNGFPRDHFSSVGDIFPKDGLISSPTEERARYTYSMSQELSSTLSMIDGVITARVHVVLPQESAGMQENAYPSSAAVFIKYSSDLMLPGFIPKVKTLVSNSIEGLSLDKITVTLFPAGRESSMVSTQGTTQALDSLLTVEVSPESKGRLMLLIFGMGILLLLSLAGIGILIWLFILRKKHSVDDASHDINDDLLEEVSEKEPQP